MNPTIITAIINPKSKSLHAEPKKVKLYKKKAKRTKKTESGKKVKHTPKNRVHKKSKAIKLSKQQMFDRYMGRKITKYPFKQMKVGSYFIISNIYSRREMSLKSNAARNWKNKSSHCKSWKFRLAKTDNNEIMITRIK